MSHQYGVELSGAPERSGGAPESRGLSGVPDPEVAEKPRRRRFSAEYKLRIVQDASTYAGSGEVGALLRREGLYSSHLSAWRRQYAEGALGGLGARKRGAKGRPAGELRKRLAQLEKENARLRRRLEEARVIVDFQKKVCEILGIPLERSGSDEDA